MPPCTVRALALDTGAREGRRAPQAVSPWRARGPNGVQITMRRILSRENLLALLLALIILALIIFTASTAPLWIYQGF